MLNRAHCERAGNGVYPVNMARIAQLRGSQLLSEPEPGNHGLMVAISRQSSASDRFRFALEGYEAQNSVLHVRIGRRDGAPSEPANGDPPEKPITPCIVLGIVAHGIQTLEVSGSAGLNETLALE